MATKMDAAIMVYRSVLWGGGLGLGYAPDKGLRYLDGVGLFLGGYRGTMVFESHKDGLLPLSLSHQIDYVYTDYEGFLIWHFFRCL